MTITQPMRTLRAPGQTDADPGTLPGFLAVAHSPDPAASFFSLRAGQNCLGREPMVAGAGQLVLRDPRISRLHATLTWQPGRDRLLLSDCNSSNGVFVNGKRIDRQLVQAGDVLRLGDTVLLLCAGDRCPPDEEDALGMVACAPNLRELRATIRRVAPSALPVLVVGATGTGKELVARALHAESGRRGPFLAVNCAALPGTLVENALFGHRKGAYTDATADQDGAFAQARGGTLFLDEIGDLSLEAQPKLLRALDNAEVTPLGAAAPLGIDVRIVVATHVPLDAAMREARFREDLYARLAGIVLKVPLLAERREDILLLFRRFLPDDLRARPPAADFVESLLVYAWPRNVRELQKLAERLPVLYPEAARWEMEMLDLEMRMQARDEPATDVRPAEPKHPLSQAELESLLERCAGNVTRVAKLAQRSRKQVYRWMSRYGISPGAGRAH
jgi:DNA-binding NtrC family response regulator